MTDIKEKESTAIKTEVEKAKVVILHNDDYNTFDHVISCLMTICGMQKHKAEECTAIVHTIGLCEVAEGDDKYLNRIKFKLQAKGLSVTIENA